MFLMPQGDPLHRGLRSRSFAPPDLLDQLRSQQLTGYARFSFSQATAVFLFCEGRMLDAAFEKNGRQEHDLEAIHRTFDLLASEEGLADVFRLSKDLALSVQALLRGTTLFADQSLRLLDVGGLLEDLKARRFTGCLRVRAQERCALIFYRHGTPLGFFHDGSTEIETSAAEYQRISALEGARLDAFESPPADKTHALDLQELLDIEKVWSVVRAQHQKDHEARSRQLEESRQARVEARLSELTKQLEEIANSHLGSMGGQILAKELGRSRGPGALLTRAGERSFLAGIEAAAKLLTGASKVRKLGAALQAEIHQARNDEVLSDVSAPLLHRT